jgi:pimeloyl-ACP methyl ester carboxylesterase
LGDRFRFVDMTYPRSTCWSLEDYGREIDAALEGEGVRDAWLLGESFGSQVMWELVRRSEWRWQGVILAGGFVHYPAPPLLRLARAVCPRISHSMLHRLLPVYFHYSRIRHSRIPGALDAARDFIARRTPEDQAAAVWRLSLIARNDPRQIAASTRLPVHHLYGAIDPIVPWPPVARWLRRHCPTLRASRCVPYSDHTVLVSAASDSVAEVCRWTA